MIPKAISLTCKVLICTFTLINFKVNAQQQDSTHLTNLATVQSKHIIAGPIKKAADSKGHYPNNAHNPGLAFRRSGFVPGWGQVYNHQWWKAPIIYTGLGLFGSAIVYNYSHYRQYLQLAVYRRNRLNVDDVNKNYNGRYADLYQQIIEKKVDYEALVNYKDSFNRDFQLSIMGAAGFWFVQMIEAYINAKFIHSYTMDNNLSLQITPNVIVPGPNQQVSVGAKLAVWF